MMRIDLDGPWGITRMLRRVLKHKISWAPDGVCPGLETNADKLRHTSPTHINDATKHKLLPFQNKKMEKKFRIY